MLVYYYCTHADYNVNAFMYASVTPYIVCSKTVAATKVAMQVVTTVMTTVEIGEEEAITEVVGDKTSKTGTTVFHPP